MIVVTTGRDPRVRQLLQGTCYPDPEHLEIVCLEMQEGTLPVAALAGFRWGDLPVIEHLTLAPGRFSVSRIRRLVQAFMGEARRRWQSRVCVAALDPGQRQARVLRRVCDRLGGRLYGADPAREWVAFYAEEPR